MNIKLAHKFTGGAMMANAASLTVFAILFGVHGSDIIADDAPGPTELCGQTYSRVAEALDQVSHDPLVATGSAVSGFDIFEDEQRLILWSFTKSGHSAYPAAVCRQVVLDGASIDVHMNILCEAGRQACDVLFKDFNDLTEKMKADFGRPQ